ncbi:hypothetical protein B0H13DRAFT_2360583 [Mycena leptocephala]|nr:hypothetical protein B0H13DRAFT_2360583 [Mycena leptocephala]
MSCPTRLLNCYKIFGLGSVFLQLLAIQYSHGEPWDLSGRTFSDIQQGRLVTTPPSAAGALEVMWRAVDPIYVAADNDLSTAQLATFENIFRAAHTYYVEDSSVIFCEYLPLPNPPSSPLPLIYIQRARKDIRFATDVLAVRATSRTCS